MGCFDRGEWRRVEGVKDLDHSTLLVGSGLDNMSVVGSCAGCGHVYISYGFAPRLGFTEIALQNS